MSLRQKSRMRMSPVKIIQPVNHSSAPSYLRRSQSESLPGIAGVSFGVQNTRGLGNMFGIKTKKSVPIDTRWNNKTFNSSSTQTSFDDENKYLEKIKMMHKENIQLNATLKERDDAIVKFSQMMHDKNAEYAKSLEAERNLQKATKKQLVESQNLVQEKIYLLHENTMHYEQLIQQLKTQYEGELTTIKKQGQADISHRDEKIAKLKRQIADIFKERSWEHQQQLEELRKELNRLTEEAQLLRIRLKREEIYKREQLLKMDVNKKIRKTNT
ncbi:trichohyalin-like isoform X2 [Ambystoma mexicanum]|uniref:trichohyalin-like isoform X2 n=1 Tax=Ambystoma mexicanum TaxID=8296 RepID=UPI0037E85DF9